MTTQVVRGRVVFRLARSRHIVIVYLAGLIAFLALGARAGTIFDDDWMPPKPPGQSHGAPTQSPAVHATSAPAGSNPAGSSPATQPTVERHTTPASQAILRQPIPAKLDLARSRGLLKAAFAAQLKDRSVAGRRQLAKALLDEVPKSADNPSDEYVLLGGVIDASKEAGDLGLCFQAADLMASQYDVDALDIKIDAVLKANLRSDSPATAAHNVQTAMDLIDPVLAAKDFNAAARIIASVRPVASSDPSLLPLVQQRGKVVDALRVNHGRLAVFTEKLKTSPNDPAANLAVGSYLCFNDGDWEKGLPMLAKGSDPGLKRLASLEIARPKTNEEILDLADGWWDATSQQPDDIRSEIFRHAASFYKTALASATGLRRTLIEHRIADASTVPAEAPILEPAAVNRSKVAVDLLSLARLDAPETRGQWSKAASGLTNSGDCRIEFPIALEGDYDLEVKLTRNQGAKEVVFIFPAGAQEELGFGGGDGNLSTLFGDPKVVVHRPKITNNVEKTLTIYVRSGNGKSNIAVSLNGTNYINWSGPAERLHANPAYASANPQFLSIRVHELSVVTFHSVRVTFKSGNGG